MKQPAQLPNVPNLVGLITPQQLQQVTTYFVPAAYIQLFQKLVLSQEFLTAIAEIPTLQRQLLVASEQRFPAAQLEQLLTISWRLLGLNGQQQAALRQALQAQAIFHFMTPLEVEFYLFELIDLVFKHRAGQQHAVLRQSFDYIELHLYEDLIVGDVALACQISANYLGRLFTARLGLSLNNYLQLRKVQLAKQAFYFNDAKVIDVGYHLAYNEPSYFSKVFKKFAYVTPRQYKKQVIQMKQHRLEVIKNEFENTNR